MNKEIICPNCSQRIKILDTIGYDLYLENLKKEEREIERLKAIVEGTKENRNELQTRIDKTIEYIETCNPNVDLNSMFLNENYISNYGAKELLNILRGEDKE